MTNKLTSAATRRKFLRGAAVAGVATIAMPQVSRAQTVTLKMQGGWGATDILNDYGKDYAAKVNEMGGGRLKIDYLNAGAVVKAFSVMDATSSGVLDGCHSVPAYWYGKHRAASLFGTGPGYGTNASQFMGWFYYGGGEALYDELTQKILKLNVQGFYVFAMPTQPLGWFKKELKGPDDFKGLKYRTVGLASNVMQAMGASVAQLPGPEILPAMEKGVIEAFEFNNPTSDSRFGAQDVAKYYYLGSYHQASEAIEVVFNKTKWDGLAKEQQQILQLAGQAANSDDIWKAWDIYSKDLADADHQAWRPRQAHVGGDLQGAARGLGQGRQRDQRGRQPGSVHQEGAREPEGVGQAGRLLLRSTTKPTSSPPTSTTSAR